jgi:hypothetical protein
MSNVSPNNLPVTLVDLTPIQVNYLNDWDHRFIVNNSGRRSRKTLIGKRKLLIQALQNNDHRYFYGAPTHAQAKRIFWNDLKRDTHYLRSHKSESELFVRLRNGTEIWVIGLDKPERIEGSPWNGCHITEYPNIKAHAWAENIRPLLSDTNGWAILDGVPEGMNHFFDRALYACGGAIPETIEGIGAFAENPDDPEWCFYNWFSSDVLPEAEIIAAKMELDERSFNQEYRGQFVSYAGLAYYAWGIHNLDVNLKYDPEQEVRIGMDFNVNPMTATLNHVMGRNVYQFGEIYLNNSNTYEMRDRIIELFPDAHKNGKIHIYPDSTGKARESNATKTDLRILADNPANFQVHAKSVNPRQKDRMNNVNSRMMAGDGLPHYFVNPKTCPETVNGWNRVESTADGRFDKKQEGIGILDITAAAGYLISFLFPVNSNQWGSYDR